MRIAIRLCSAFVLAFSCFATRLTTAEAATVYRCAGSDGAIAFQDQPCRAGGTQRVLDIVSHDPPASVDSVMAEKPERPERSWAAGVSRKRVAEPMSFACRTNTGMLFYRHSRCPTSLSDGTDGNGRSRRVMVSSQAVERREACRRMRNGTRDGDEFDDKVSTYERNLGRDTCRAY